MRNNDMLKDEIFDTALRNAVAQCIEEECAPIREEFANGAEPDYSPQFRRRMGLLLKRNKPSTGAQWQKYGKRAAAIAVVLGVGFFSAMSVEAVRVRVNDFFLSITSENTVIDLDGIDSIRLYIPDGWDFVYSPTYLPKGYLLTRVEHLGTYLDATYGGDGQKDIQFQQSPSFEGMVALDTEDALTEQVQIGKLDGVYVEKNSNSMLFWSNNDGWFMLTTTLGREETIKIAASVEKTVN